MACNASCSPRATFLGSSSTRCLKGPRFSRAFQVRAVQECNEEECAPTKEVGKVSMEWLAEEKTKVAGTFPPMSKLNRISGYVEKDSAGQSNIYAVEPQVYVAETAISTGSAGASAEGSDATLAIVAGLLVVTLAGCGAILNFYSVKNINESQQQLAVEYSGPPLGYYIEKFQPPQVAASASSALEQVEVEAPAVTALEQVEVEAPAVTASDIQASDEAASMP